MPNPYTPARLELEREAARVADALKTVAALEAAWSENTGETSKKARLLAAKRGHGTAVGDAVRGGRRDAVNKDGQTWTEALRAVLADGRARTVGEIVEALTASGRAFGENTNPEALVRSTLHRTARKQGWGVSKSLPRRWKLQQGGSS